MFQGFPNENKLEKKEKEGDATLPLHLLVTYFGKNSLRHPRDSKVTKKTQVHHICRILHWLGAHLNGTSIHISTQNCHFKGRKKLRGRIKFINILFCSRCNTKTEYLILCGPLLSALTFASHSDPTPKSLLCTILARKSKCLFPGTSATILLPSSQHCVLLFLRKSSGMWCKSFFSLNQIKH